MKKTPVLKALELNAIFLAIWWDICNLTNQKIKNEFKLQGPRFLMGIYMGGKKSEQRWPISALPNRKI
jgi:hypothetical protein